MNLFALPPELLEAILARVASRASLASLARVCQQLRPVVERILYQSVYLRNHDGKKFAYALDCLSARAEYVQELLVHYHYVEVPDEEDYYPCYAESLAPTISRLVKLRSLVVKGLEYDAEREDDDEYLGGYERVIEETKKWNDLFAQSAMPGSQILQSLTKCQLNMDDVDRSEPLWDFRLRGTVMIHPYMKDLTILGANVSGLEDSLMASTRSTSLERLSLFCCDAAPRGIQDLLSLPRALKHFTYKGAPWTHRPYNLMEDRQKCIDTVKVQADSLNTLDMDFYPGNWDNPALDFRDFSCLEQLTVDPRALRGDGKFDPKDNNEVCLWKSPELKCQLPLGLKRLVFFEYHEQSTPDLYTLLLVYNWVSRGSLPNLETITVQSAKSSKNAILNSPFGDNSGRSVFQALQEVGVQLRVERVLDSTEAGYQLFDCDRCGVCWRIRGIHFL
ncbi:hypothetical protein BO94DRAFT_494943 [Aspergillus sclerotioniger CBS 115572]|uniref:F-box domain-containing protein n=1 Tax=Aspergillus sclerotioniger CBS 115572 TaxID=1450535 RepID=A0A317WDE2_9EURO|nr:hypothetical protein BO94DRAFT_494943 [Aspergillus sclerotioniger CBS 115572]PWY83781.1 hypothetical protein BO94DRAFT_494943 [Aspergillus sclerotioniger CBS 115572]